MRSECNLSFEAVLLKLEAYCAYQDRCSFEVNQKLGEFSLSPEDNHKIIHHLITKRFLDDKRFAESFCSGKFKIKKWGRLKIKQSLRLKKLTEEQIQYGMHEAIDADKYWDTLVDLAQRKWNETEREKDVFKRKAKVIRFLAQRGFEQDLIFAALDNMG